MHPFPSHRRRAAGRASTKPLPRRRCVAIAVARTAAILLLLAAAPPASAAKKPAPPPEPPKLSEADTRQRLAQFYTVFVNSVEASTSRASIGETDVDQLRQVTLVKIRAVRACRAAVFQENVMAALVDTWGLCVQTRVYLESPAARKELGDDAAALVNFARAMQDRIESIATEFIPAERMAEMRAKMGAFASDHPMTKDRAVEQPSSQMDRNLPGMGWVLRLPLAPFRAMEGVDNTASAVVDLSKVADNFTRTVGSVPLESAWEMELLLLQARRDVTAVLNELDAKQAGLQTTLREVRGALADTDRIVARIEPIAGSTERTVQGIATASGALDQLLHTAGDFVRQVNPPPALGAPVEPVKPEAEKTPFDIRDYARTAEGITAAANELRGLLQELNTTATSPALTRGLNEARSAAEATLARVEATTHRLLWWIAIDALGLILATLAAALAYRRIVLRWTAARPIGD